MATAIYPPACSRSSPDRRACVLRRTWRAAVLSSFLFFPLLAAAVSQITLQVGDLRHDQLTLRNAQLQMGLGEPASLVLRAEQLRYGERQWRQVELRCARAALGAGAAIDCPDGTLAGAEGTLPLAFRFEPAARRLQLTLRPDAKERWAVTAAWQGERWQGELQAEQGRLQRLQGLATLPVQITRGVVQGHARIEGDGQGLGSLSGRFQLQELAFSDAAGSRAAEALAGAARLSATRAGARWNWRLETDWQAGEVYWQPFYFAEGGHRLRAAGWVDDARFAVDTAHLELRGVGAAEFRASVRRSDGVVEALDVAARDLDMAATYELLLKPQLVETMLADLETGGRADFTASWRYGQAMAFDIALRDFDVEDRKGRFALYKVDARVPWELTRPTRAALRYAGGRMLKIPLQAADLAATLDGFSLTAPVLRVPLLDGALTLQEVSAAYLNRQWHWHVSASLSPVSMADLSHALGWPVMQGKLAASVPMVTYSYGRMDMDGAMGLDVFDGSIVVDKLVLRDPLGLAPRLSADIRMRDLDLELLTRTFSFGAMAGRLDVDVNDLVLSRWRPVRFDAAVRSSPGKYPKKISQRAVENISALGGAGAAAAIQRSFLRFFKEFNYAEIGLSCQLRNGVCRMDGVAPADGGYVIVKGSGVPAITVLGYNRSVGWDELLTRLKRVTQDGAAPVIK